MAFLAYFSSNSIIHVYNHVLRDCMSHFLGGQSVGPIHLVAYCKCDELLQYCPFQFASVASCIVDSAHSHTSKVAAHLALFSFFLSFFLFFIETSWKLHVIFVSHMDVEVTGPNLVVKNEYQESHGLPNPNRDISNQIYQLTNRDTDS